MLFNKQPKYKLFKTFGCVCYPLLCPYNTHNFEFRSFMCLFIGHSSIHKGYLYLSPYCKTYITQHFIFNKFVFPYALVNNPLNMKNYYGSTLLIFNYSSTYSHS